MSTPLEEELKYFNQQRAKLLETAAGKFALVKNKQIIGTFDDADNAYEAGTRQFPGEEFLIQEILPTDMIQDIPAYYLGLLHVV